MARQTRLLCELSAASLSWCLPAPRERRGGGIDEFQQVVEPTPTASSLATAAHLTDRHKKSVANRAAAIARREKRISTAHNNPKRCAPAGRRARRTRRWVRSARHLRRGREDGLQPRAPSCLSWPLACCCCSSSRGRRRQHRTVCSRARAASRRRRCPKPTSSCRRIYRSRRLRHRPPHLQPPRTCSSRRRRSSSRDRHRSSSNLVRYAWASSCWSWAPAFRHGGHSWSRRMRATIQRTS